MIKEACFKITEDCPCNCAFCDSDYKNRNILSGKTMQFEQWKVICDKLIEQQISAVVISGGEPLLQSELTLKIINYLRNKDVYVVLNTSGVLFKGQNLLKKIVNDPPNLIVFSVDSCIKEKHDMNRNMPGLFEQVVDSIKYFKENNNISVGIRTVITRYNFRELSKIITFFGQLGIDCIKLTNIENDVQGIYRLNYNDLIEFDKVVRPEMIKSVSGICKDNTCLQTNIVNINGLFGRIEDYKNIANGIFSPTYIGNSKCCLQGHFLSIQSDGCILPCCEAEHHFYPVLGNLLKEDIQNIIASELYNEFLNKRLDYCKRCTQNLNYQISFTNSTKIVERR